MMGLFPLLVFKNPHGTNAPQSCYLIVTGTIHSPQIKCSYSNIIIDLSTKVIRNYITTASFATVILCSGRKCYLLSSLPITSFYKHCTTSGEN